MVASESFANEVHLAKVRWKVEMEIQMGVRIHGIMP